MTKKVSASIMYLLAIAFAFSLSTNALALSYNTYDGNIFKLDYFELISQFPELEGKVNPDSWPSQQEPDIEAEVGDPFPDFGETPFLIIKQANVSYIIDVSDGVPTSWDDFAGTPINGISSYAVPEGSDMILLGLFLLFITAISKKRFNKSSQ